MSAIERKRQIEWILEDCDKDQKILEVVADALYAAIGQIKETRRELDQELDDIYHREELELDEDNS